MRQSTRTRTTPRERCASGPRHGGVQNQLLPIGAHASEAGFCRFADAPCRLATPHRRLVRGLRILGGQYKAVRRLSLARARYGGHVSRLISLADILLSVTQETCNHRFSLL